MVQLLPDSSWEFGDTFHRRLRELCFLDACNERGIFSETIARITDHSRPHDCIWKRVIPKAPSYFFLRLRQKKASANEHDSQVEEEVMQSDVMDAEGSLHQKPRITEDTESIDLRWFDNTKSNRVKNVIR